MAGEGQQPVKLVFFDDAKDNQPKALEFSWEDICGFLTDHERTPCAPCPGKDCPHKNGAAWSPVEYLPGKRRALENVLWVTLAVLDIDDATEAEAADMGERLQGYAYVVHSSHSHAPQQDRWRLRLVMPLSRPVSAREWLLVRRAVVEKFQLSKADEKAKDPSRLFFLPSCPAGGEEPVAEVGEGAVLDVEVLLKGAKVSAAAHLGTPTSTIVPVRPVVKATGEVDMARLRLLCRNYVPKDEDGRRELWRAFVKGEALAEEGGRDHAVNRVCGMLAFCLPNDTPIEAAMELLRPSLAALPGEGGVDHWVALAQEKYSRAYQRRLRRDAERMEQQELLRAKLGVDRREARVAEHTAMPPPVASEEADEDDEDPNAWRALLITTKAKDDEMPKLKQVGANAAAILTYAPEWKGVLKFNEVSKQVEMHGGPVPEPERADVGVAVTNWLARSDWGLVLPRYEVDAQLSYVARCHPYDPLKQYLLGLKWDQQPRLASWLTRYLSAQPVSLSGGDIREYLKAVGTKWFISAVARALRPGCKVDTVLVLEAPQGSKKSTAFKILGGEFFSDSALQIADKDSKLLAAQSWIIELAELDALRKSEAQTQKAFLSSATDKFRPPYAAKVESFPRRCVFVGTTNDDTYLGDYTGNRRYWPVKVGEADADALQADRDQLWAEAVVLFQAGERWWLSAEESDEAEGQTASRVTTNAVEDPIWRWWVGMEPQRRPARVAATEVAELALKMSPVEYATNTRLQGLLTYALRTLGFTRRSVLEPGRKTPVRVWEPSEELRTIPKGEGKLRILQLVASARLPETPRPTV